MKDLNSIKKILTEHKSRLFEDYHVEFIGIFGSYANGKALEGSDVDILVEFSKPPDMFKFLQLEEHLTLLLGIKVDLVTKKALKPLIRNAILKEVTAA